MPQSSCATVYKQRVWPLLRRIWEVQLPAPRDLKCIFKMNRYLYKYTIVHSPRLHWTIRGMEGPCSTEQNESMDSLIIPSNHPYSSAKQSYSNHPWMRNRSHVRSILSGTASVVGPPGSSFCSRRANNARSCTSPDTRCTIVACSRAELPPTRSTPSAGALRGGVPLPGKCGGPSAPNDTGSPGAPMRGRRKTQTGGGGRDGYCRRSARVAGLPKGWLLLIAYLRRRSHSTISLRR